jgi:uncharacterized cysteine cluster protein YcgN (CxxCxxCC family)
MFPTGNRILVCGRVGDPETTALPGSVEWTCEDCGHAVMASLESQREKAIRATPVACVQCRDGNGACSNSIRRKSMTQADEKLTLTLMIVRKAYTAHVLAWLHEDAQAAILVKVRHVAQLYPALPIDRLSTGLRSEVLKAITPTGGFPSEPAFALGMLCRFIEAGSALVDWDWIVSELCANHIQGGK